VLLFFLHCLAALRSGVPTIVTPVFGDQYDNSFVVQKLGVGFGFERKLQDIDVKDLSNAIDVVLNDPTIAKRAKTVGSQLRDNEWDERAIVEEVETYWKETVTSGKFLDEVRDWNEATAERKSYYKKKTLRDRVTIGFALVAAIVAFLVK